MAKESVKSVCEESIRSGRSVKQIMSTLDKKFDKSEETYTRSIKYYASALHRAGDIDDEAKAKYVGTPGKSSTKKSIKKSMSEDKSSKTSPKKKTSKDSDKKKSSKDSTKKKSSKGKGKKNSKD